jgi:hypothetical protein
MFVYSAFWDRAPETFYDKNLDEFSRPQTGETREVFLEPSDDIRKSLHSDSIINLLWYPSYSEINGWDLKREEILGTFVIQCQIVSKALNTLDARSNWLRETNFISRNAQKFRVQILSTTPFVNFCQNQTEIGANSFLYEMGGLASNQPCLIWERCKSYHKIALKDNVYYLEGWGVQELHLALILEDTGNEITIKFQDYSYSWQEEMQIISYTLNTEKHSIFRRILEQAKEY